MKSYSVKSNAKRFARGIVAKLPPMKGADAPNVRVLEPVPVEDGERGWYPAIQLVGNWPEDLKQEMHSQFGADVVIHGLASDAAPINEAEPEPSLDVAICDKCFAVYEPSAERCPHCGGEGRIADDDSALALDADLEADFETAFGVDVSSMTGAGAVTVTVDLPYGPEQAAIVERLLAEGRTVVAPDHTGAMVTHEPPAPVLAEGGNDGRVVEIEEPDEPEEPKTPLTMAEAKAVVTALATLPPRVKRTPEQIAQAREERRARIAAGEYKATAPAPKEAKVSKSALVYAAIKAEGGASFEDLIALTDWQRHTLRGYIAGTLRKRAANEGLEIEAFKAPGEPTRYRALPV